MLLPANRRRILQFCLAFAAVSGLFSWFFAAKGSPYNVNYVKSLVTPPADLDLPPTWDQLKKWELNLPQHNPDLPFPEGKTGRYLFLRSEIQMLGWNNVLNERLLNSYLAYKTKRAYVFQDYAWKPEYYPWSRSKFRDHPPRTPLNALIAGPTVGGPWDEGDEAPRSIGARFYDTVCPEKDRRIINTQEIKPQVTWETGDIIFRHWEKLLLEAPERCIEIHSAPFEQDGTPQVFDLWLWGSDRILPLWDEFSKSPVSRLLATSPVINAAVDRNEYLLMPRERLDYPVSRNPYDRLLSIHLRRGDFKKACADLANWNSTFYSWNLLPFLPDVFVPPPGGKEGVNSPENIELYMLHCFPTFDQIVDKINNSRDEYVKASKGKKRTLDVLFLLTNDHSEWLDKLKDTLRSHGWHTIVTTRDLVLDQEGKEVGMAVDMEIARRAAVFIGNGWSSFTSNIVYRRLVDGKEPVSTRFY